ncbi:MAG: phage tail protein [Symploca sp. SIO1B1]|nr:phage tail protein [Symploca sp. SIO1C2]NER47877.1 phage tail protein [Symploca sp. SIO1A3]NER92624.1 phage tail protein [Symploca sp. SIO1B1]
MVQPYIGEIRMFGGNFAPVGWAFCDGSLLFTAEHDALFSLLGTVYGGNGRTTFALPDLRSRIPIHYGSGPGLTPRSLGAKGGSESITLSSNQIPKHTHSLSAVTEAANSLDPEGLVNASSSVNTYTKSEAPVNMGDDAVASSGGGDQSFNNWQPFLCVNFIIALTGIYPTRV